MGKQAVEQGGLGYVLYGKDDGFVSLMKKAGSALRSTNDKLKTFGIDAKKISAEAAGSLKEMALKAAGHAGHVVKGFDNMVDSAMNADTGYDAAIAGFQKNFSAITVGMNMSSKETQKWAQTIISTHFKTAESMEDMGRAFAGFRQQNIDLEQAMGVKGTAGAMTRLAKEMSVFGVDGQKLAGVYSELKKTFGVNEAEARKLGDRIFSVGKVFGVGREAIQQWPDIVSEVSKEFADLGKKAGPGEIAKIAQGITVLGGTLSQALGKPAEESIGLARQIFTTLSGERRGVMDMFRGMGGEIGELGLKMAESGASVDEMFSLFQKSPEEFMKGLHRLAGSAKAMNGEMGPQFQRLAGTVNKVLGPDATNLMRADWSKVTKLLGEVPKAVAGSNDAMGKAAEAAHKYVGEGSFIDILMNRFRWHIRGLTTSNFAEWQKNITKGFHGTQVSLTKLANDPNLGGLTKRLLMVQRVGLSGLFTSGDKSGSRFAMIAQQATGAAMALQHLGIRISDIPSLLSAGGPLILGMALFDKKLRKDIIGAVKGGAKWLKEKGPGAMKEAAQAISEVWDDVRPMVDFAMDALREALPKVQEGLINMVHGINWDAVGSQLGDWAGSALETMGDAIWNASKGAAGARPVGVSGALGKAAVVLGKGLIKGMFHAIWSDHAGIGENLGRVAKTIAGVVAAGALLSPTLRSALAGYGKKFLGKFWDGVKDGSKTGFGKTVIAVGAAVLWMKENMGKEWDDLTASLSDKNATIGDNFRDTASFMLVTAMKFVDQMTGGFAGKFIGGFDNIMGRMKVYWKTAWHIMKDVGGDVAYNLEKSWYGFWSGMKLWAATGVSYVKAAFVSVFGTIAGKIGGFLGDMGLSGAFVDKLNKWGQDAADAMKTRKDEIDKLNRDYEIDAKNQDFEYRHQQYQKQMAAEMRAIQDEDDRENAKARAEAAAREAKDKGESSSRPTKAKTSTKLPNAHKPVPDHASTQEMAQNNALMAQQLASMNQQLAAMSARPIQVDMHLDGRRFGSALFKPQEQRLSYGVGNLGASK